MTNKAKPCGCTHTHTHTHTGIVLLDLNKATNTTKSSIICHEIEEYVK